MPLKGLLAVVLLMAPSSGTATRSLLSLQSSLVPCYLSPRDHVGLFLVSSKLYHSINQINRILRHVCLFIVVLDSPIE